VAPRHHAQRKCMPSCHPDGEGEKEKKKGKPRPTGCRKGDPPGAALPTAAIVPREGGGGRKGRSTRCACSHLFCVGRPRRPSYAGCEHVLRKKKERECGQNLFRYKRRRLGGCVSPHNATRRGGGGEGRRKGCVRAALLPIDRSCHPETCKCRIIGLIRGGGGEGGGGKDGYAFDLIYTPARLGCPCRPCFRPEQGEGGKTFLFLVRPSYPSP